MRAGRRLKLFLTCLCLLPSGAAATADRFEVPFMTVDLWPLADGHLRARYEIQVKNPGAVPQRILRIGTPGSSPQLSMSIANQPVGENDTIAITVESEQINEVFQDPGDRAYAGVRFDLTNFDPDSTHGTTQLTVNWHFPAGVTANEAKFDDQRPTRISTDGGHLVFSYERTTSPSAKVTTGIGFPARYVQPGAFQTPTLRDRLRVVPTLTGVAILLAAAVIAVTWWWKRRAKR
jgi:hypothetical protein